MKYLPILLIIALTNLTNCKKESDDCPSCVLVIANGEAYAYKVTLQGTAQTPFTLQPGELKNITIQTGVLVTVKGDYLSPFAHNDFSKAYQCPGDCGAVSVILKE